MYSLQYLNIILAKKENESRRLKLLITVLGPLSYYFHIKSLVESEPLVVVVMGGGIFIPSKFHSGHAILVAGATQL